MSNVTSRMNQTNKSSVNVKKLTMTAMLAAVATVLMFFSFNVPLMPSYLKLDFSELPALIAAFAMGPVSGVFVVLVKNLINLMFTTTGGVGELSNFLLGCCFVIPAGLFYQKMQSRKGAFIGALIGAIVMAVCSLATNYFLVYPFYFNIMPRETVMNMYQIINPNVDTLIKGLLIFNMTFTFIKGLISLGLSFAIYKGIAPLLKNKNFF